MNCSNTTVATVFGCGNFYFVKQALEKQKRTERNAEGCRFGRETTRGGAKARFPGLHPSGGTQTRIFSTRLCNLVGPLKESSTPSLFVVTVGSFAPERQLVPSFSMPKIS